MASYKGLFENLHKILITLLMMDLLGDQKYPLPKICLTYPTMITFWTVIPYPKNIQKMHKSCDTPLDCWHQHVFTENQQIFLYQEILNL